MTRTEAPRQTQPKDIAPANELVPTATGILERHLVRFKEHNTEDLSRKLLGEMTTLGHPSNLQTNLDIVNVAINIAGKAHKEKEQKRMFTGNEYLVHPLRVALLTIDLAKALNIPITPELIAGAVLHDVPEDNENYPREIIRVAFQEFETEMPGISERIADDAEAFNHNNNTRTGRLTSPQYHHKITDTQDEQVLQRRKIIKIADRLDNLLDPPLSLQDVVLFPEKYIEKREDFIRRTEDSEAIIHLLLSEFAIPDTIDAKLMEITEKFLVKSKETLKPGFISVK